MSGQTVKLTVELELQPSFSKHFKAYISKKNISLYISLKKL